MSLSALALAAFVASPLDDIAPLLLAKCLMKTTSGTTLSDFVVEGIRPSTFSGDTEMTAKTTPVVDSSSSNDAEMMEKIMAQLVAARGTKGTFSTSTWLADKAADAGKGVARIAAGGAAGWENATLSFAGERERQTRRTAASILASARAS